MGKVKDVVKDRVMSHFETALNSALSEHGWTRSYLKKETGVSTERYNNREGGREPSLSSAVRIADALGLSLDQMCGRTPYAQDTDTLNAGECLEMIVLLLNQLGGNYYLDGDFAKLTFPPSNVTLVLGSMQDYEKDYKSFFEAASKFTPDAKLKPVREEVNSYLDKKIAELKDQREPIQIELYGSDTFEAFDGSVFLGPECIVDFDDDQE